MSKNLKTVLCAALMGMCLLTTTGCSKEDLDTPPSPLNTYSYNEKTLKLRWSTYEPGDENFDKSMIYISSFSPQGISKPESAESYILLELPKAYFGKRVEIKLDGGKEESRWTWVFEFKDAKDGTFRQSGRPWYTDWESKPPKDVFVKEMKEIKSGYFETNFDKGSGELTVKFDVVLKNDKPLKGFWKGKPDDKLFKDK